MPDFFKTLLLLQFIFDHSEIFTGETRHIVHHPITKAEFQISAYNSRNCRNIAEITDFFQTLLLLQFLFNHSEIFTGETSIYCHPITKAEFQISAYNSRNCRNIAEITYFFHTLLLLQFLFNHSEFFTGETRHIVSPL